MEDELLIVKASGERKAFQQEKLERSLARSGANKSTINAIVEKVVSELYDGISTKEIYNRAFALLKKQKPVFASRYKLKKAIYELGPTGFPFEKFVGALMQYSGYTIKNNAMLEGICVSHEVDLVARNNRSQLLMECKFHSEAGRNCDVKIPLYINSRFNDIKATDGFDAENDEGWVVTNTRFTKDAMQYGLCVGLHLLSWDYPLEDGLKDRIDRLGLYPITVSTLLTKREKQFLLSRDVVLCRQLLKDTFFLDHLGLSKERQDRVLGEINALCVIPA